MTSLYDLLSSSPLPLYLNPHDLLQLACCCHQLHHLITADSHFDENNWRGIYESKYHKITTSKGGRSNREYYHDLFRSNLKRRTERFTQTEDGGSHIPVSRHLTPATGPLHLMDGWGAAVLLHGKPLAYNWPCDHIWSIDRLFCTEDRDISQASKDESQKLGHVLNQGLIQPEEPLTVQFKRLVDLLGRGEYLFELHPSDSEWTMTAKRNVRPYSTIAYEETPGNRRYAMNFNYHSNDCPWSTQSVRKLDESRIEYYKKEIEKGRRPIVLGALPKQMPVDTDFPMPSDIFILDGHHKYLAYHEKNIQPAWLMVKRLRQNSDEDFITVDDRNSRLTRENLRGGELQATSEETTCFQMVKKVAFEETYEEDIQPEDLEKMKRGEMEAPYHSQLHQWQLWQQQWKEYVDKYGPSAISKLKN
ncbi:hypothetical protein PROFUN_13627 [Planoprotostelium fungivorum]|uniref:F-box domain-containing protein n=1 Tax=Planoprotostelium fungivorum TaxID=1890364 RepID=A0A2P6MZY4_9EUKA|nr:hypothetical protein PROFUN_13627 [Planoprotostelium fungivorum]